MKARTKVKGGYVFFTYEVNDLESHGSWKKAVKARDKYPNGFIILTGWVYSDWFGASERIDELELKDKPSTEQVKRFMRSCYNVILHDQNI